MSRRVKQTGFRLLAAILLAAAMSFQSLAATARVAFSDPTTQVGQEVSITMKFTSTSGEMLGDTDVMLAYDGTMLEFISGTGNVSGGNGAIRVKSAPMGATETATELRFKSLRAGTATITITSCEGYDNNGQILTVQEGSSTVTIQGLETSSNDATLKSLQVSPGTLEPAFTPMQETYTVTVGLETDRLAVSGEPNNDNAKITVEGGSELSEGTNTVVCRVTAEDGTTVKNYTITVNKVEGGENTEAPAGGESAAATMEVLAEIEGASRRIRITALPDQVEPPKGFVEKTVRIGDTEVSSWFSEADKESNYCLLYGMNEDGEPGFYCYDVKEKTIQRYFTAGSADPEITKDEYDALGQKYNDLVDDYNLIKYLLFGCAVVAVILLIALIVVLRNAGRGGRADRFGPGGRRAGGSSLGGRRADGLGQGGRQGDKDARVPNGRRLTREERYMLGEDDDNYDDPDGDDMADDGYGDGYDDIGYYDDDDDYGDMRAYQPEPARGEKPLRGRPGGAAAFGGETDIVEERLASDLAKEAAITAEDIREPEDNEGGDFEFFELDEDNEK